MPDHALLGPWVRRFLLEHVVSERNLSRHTQSSYRDTLALLIPFAADTAGKPVDQLCVVQVSAVLVRQFLQHLEDSRRCTIATRNQRLAALHAWALFVGRNSPEHVDWCGEIRAIAFKRSTKPLVPYLEKQEMDALLEAPDRSTPQGRRDSALLLFLYNSGARADEAAQLTIAGLELSAGTAAVTIHGKGNKIRRCPLWSKTVTELKELIADRASSETRLSQSLWVAHHSLRDSYLWWNPTRRRRTCYALESISTPFGPGSAMSLLIPLSSMLKSIWPAKPKLSLIAKSRPQNRTNPGERMPVYWHSCTLFDP